MQAMGRPLVGVALGSGAARGWAHVGVLEVLQEEGISLDIVVGSSSGALAGAFYAIGELEMLSDWGIRLDWRETMRLLDIRPTGGGLIQGERLMAFLFENRRDVLIEDLPMPFAAVATDLDSGREVWLREGPLTTAVRASIAIPGLFSPVRHGGRWLVDGGLVNPVPVAPCRALGADVVIAVNLNGDLVARRRARRANPGRGRAGKARSELIEALTRKIAPSGGFVVEQLLGTGPERPGFFDVVLGSINIMQDRLTRSRMAGDPPDVMVVPQLPGIALLDFNRAEEAIEEGRRSMRRMLPVLRGLIGLA